MSNLFDPYRLGGIKLRNRIAMAPMTRARSLDTNPNQTMAEYYRQRASAGLIVTEGTPISPEAQGYVFVPGIFTDEQISGWKTVTDAVHGEGGHIFCQLWHVGRLSHVSIQEDGQAPVSSGEKAAEGCMTFAYTDDGEVGFINVSAPRPLSTEEVARVHGDFAAAAASALSAGFDGVELHGANGYLFEQFLNPATNNRTDRYGGSLTNRCRFLLEAVDRVIAEVGPNCVGIRLSPFSDLFDMPAYPEARDTYMHLASELSDRGIAYTHLIDQNRDGGRLLDPDFLTEFRGLFTGTILLAGAISKDIADDLVGRGLIDMPAFGQPFISNPDLVDRLRNDWPLTEPDPATYYGGGGPEGYIDYPRFDPATV